MSKLVIKFGEYGMMLSFPTDDECYAAYKALKGAALVERHLDRGDLHGTLGVADVRIETNVVFPIREIVPGIADDDESAAPVEPDGGLRVALNGGAL